MKQLALPQRISPATPFFWLFLLVILTTLAPWTVAQTKTVNLSFTEKLGLMEMGRFALGQGGLSDEPMWDQRIAEVRALRPKLVRLFIQEYFNLLPEPGTYHFDTLDRSVQTILAAGAKPLMCICFKPRVLFPQVDQRVVEPGDYKAWEELIYETVRHYQKRGAGIQYWEVGNEVDIGENGGCPYLFQPESYVRYYQHTVAAILRADPQARVGGPALAGWTSPILPALLDFCSQGNAPLHFVSWHIYSDSPSAIRGTIEGVKGLLKKYPQLKPETILNEWSLGLDNPPRDPRFHPCYIAETAWQMKEAGLDYACYYHIRDYHVVQEQFAPFMSPRGTAFMTRWWNQKPQFDGLFDFQNTMRPAYFSFKLLSRLRGERLRLDSRHAQVHGFAAHDPEFQLHNLMLWNFSAEPAEVEVICQGLDATYQVSPLILDALTAHSDENVRLRAEKEFQVNRDQATFKTRFEPYGVRFWSFEKR